MTTSMKIALSFILGGAIGSIASWQLLKGYYQKEADEQVKSVIDTFTENKKKDEQEMEALRKSVQKYEKEEYERMTKDLYSPSCADEEHPVEEDYPDVLSITLDEVGNEDCYEVRHMTWYPRQGILTTEDDEPVYDPRYYVGSLDNLHRYDDIAGDEIYLRNEKISHDMIIEISEDDYVE